MLNKFNTAVLAKNICSILHKTFRHHCELPAVVMNNGNEMPIIGLGTFNGAASNEGKNQSTKENSQKMANAVEWAIDAGYRHFDCAPVYTNQKEIGQALQKRIESKSVAREDLFITSKLWNTSHHPENVCKACEQTLADLKLEYLDMYLMHSPMGFQPSNDFYPKRDDKVLTSDIDYVDTWLAMEDLVAKNMCTNIGVSNFNAQQLRRLLKNCKIVPQTLQIELHPYLTQQQLIYFAKCHDICLTSYAPLGSPAWIKTEKGKSLLEDYKILQMAEKYQRSPAQILLRFQVQCGHAVIPKSTDKKHLKDNLNIFDFELCPDDVQNIESLNHNTRYFQFKGAAGHPHHPFETTNEKTV